MLKGKIHGARVTAADLHYEGSILIDSSLLEQAGILPYESVQVWNLTNGNRFETYTIPAPPDSGTILVNGAAARLTQSGDKIIITAFCEICEEEARSYSPKVVLVDNENKGHLKA